jgi:DNA invertase Pin-like site-specific DNA recombinase
MPVRSEGPPLAEATLKRLVALGKRRDAALRRLERVDAEVWAAIPAAVSEGVPKLRVAAALGVARQTVYDVLAREESG